MKIIYLILLILFISACDDAATTANIKKATPVDTTTTNSADPHDLKALAGELGSADGDAPQIQPIITADGKTQINWAYIATKEPKADTASYIYPIAIDTQAVTNYANSYGITPAQAQHSIVIGMAAPEVLSKVLDQLQGKYIGHRLTDGANMSLIITTTPDVVADRYEYVFADTFGRGLVIPIIIEPNTDGTP